MSHARKGSSAPSPSREPGSSFPVLQAAAMMVPWKQPLCPADCPAGSCRGRTPHLHQGFGGGGIRSRGWWHRKERQDFPGAKSSLAEARFIRYE